MAIINEITNLGLTANAANLAASTHSPVVRIEVGSGFVSTAAAARALTDIRTPFSPVRQNNSPVGQVDGATEGNPTSKFQVAYRDSVVGNQYVIRELGVFITYNGTETLMGYICDDAGASLGSKVSDTPLVLGANFSFSNGAIAQLRFSEDFNFSPLANEDTYGLVRLGDNNSNSSTEVWSTSRIRSAITSIVNTAISGVTSVTNLSVSRFLTSVRINSSTGTDATIPAVSTGAAGVLSTVQYGDAIQEVSETNARLTTTSRGRLSPRRMHDAKFYGWSTTTQAVFDARTTRVPGRIFLIPE